MDGIAVVNPRDLLFITCNYNYSRFNNVFLPMILDDYYLLESFLEINSRRKSLMPIISESNLSICRIPALILCFDFHLRRFVRVHVFWFCIYDLKLLLVFLALILFGKNNAFQCSVNLVEVCNCSQ